MTAVRRPQSNGFIEQLQRTLLDEHFRVEGRRTWYETPEQMQEDLDVFDSPVQRQGVPRCSTDPTGAAVFDRRLHTAACFLGGQVGRALDGIVTGSSPKGTWARIFDPPVEGRITRGSEGLDVGDRVRIKLIHTDPERSFIDFVFAGHIETHNRG